MHYYLVRNKTALWDSEHPEISLVYRQVLICHETFSKSTFDRLDRAGPLINAENRSISLMMLHRRAKLKEILRHLPPANTIMSMWTGLLLLLHKWAKSILTKREKWVPFSLNTPSAILSWYKNCRWGSGGSSSHSSPQKTGQQAFPTALWDVASYRPTPTFIQS